MTRRLTFTYLLIAVFVLVVLEVPLALNYRQSERDWLTTEVERDAVVAGSLVEDQLEAGVAAISQDLVAALEDYVNGSGARVVVTDARGISRVDTDPAFTVPRDFSTRGEIAAALRGERATGTRHSDTLGTDLLYVAVPVASGGELHGTVRITYPTTVIDQRVRERWTMLVALAVVILAATGVVAVAFARWVTRPTRAVEDAVERFATGDLGARAPTDRGPDEVRALARQFNDTAVRVGELLTAQRAFVADASHQLRSPLTALRLELEELALDPANRGGVDRAIGEVGRLARTVDGLLLLARADGVRPTVEGVDVAAVVAHRVEIWGGVADEAEVGLTANVPAELRAIAVPGSLEQILDNLLANAIEATPPAGHVTVSARAGARVTLEVADDGPGMTPEQLGRAFDRFWRGTSSPSGSGLGLPIARQLARASGGELGLAQRPGGGLVAWVTLDAVPEGRHPADAVAVPGEVASPRPGG